MVWRRRRAGLFYLPQEGDWRSAAVVPAGAAGGDRLALVTSRITLMRMLGELR